MKVSEKIESVIKATELVQGNDKLIMAAYYKGREDVAREICDKAHAIFVAQKLRASKSRYHHLALSVQGSIDIIYHPDYAGDYYHQCLADDEIITDSAEPLTQQSPVHQ